MNRSFADLDDTERDAFAAAFYSLWDADEVLSDVPHDTESAAPWGASWYYAPQSDVVSAEEHFAACVDEIRELAAEESRERQLA